MTGGLVPSQLSSCGEWLASYMGTFQRILDTGCLILATNQNFVCFVCPCTWSLGRTDCNRGVILGDDIELQQMTIVTMGQ